MWGQTHLLVFTHRNKSLRKQRKAKQWLHHPSYVDSDRELGSHMVEHTGGGHHNQHVNGFLHMSWVLLQVSSC